MSLLIFFILCLSSIFASDSYQDFKEQESRRREIFFANKARFLDPQNFLDLITKQAKSSFALPLNQQICVDQTGLALYTDQFYRFLIQSNTPPSHLIVKVYKDQHTVYTEEISLPLKYTKDWELYLINDGMLHIPNGPLKECYGLDLRLSFVPDPVHHVLILSQKGSDTTYQFSVSLQDSETLYTYRLVEPPPWQLEVLRKPSLPFIEKALPSKTPLSPDLIPSKAHLNNGRELPPSEILDRFVEELKGDPLALAQYVLNEIKLVDPFVYQKEGIFHPPSIHRSAQATFLDRQGSAWEQCMLLVYLLRKAGYQASYAYGALCALPKEFTERMLFIHLEKNDPVHLKYPWVQFFDGERWISLFPWMKEIDVSEGYDLYTLLPDEYVSADRFIKRYLCNDEAILKYIGPDGDDSLTPLFIRFVADALKQQGLSLHDVGIKRNQIKKQCSSWEDFPTPEVIGTPTTYTTCRNLNIFASLEVKLDMGNYSLALVKFPYEFHGTSITCVFSKAGQLIVGGNYCWSRTNYADLPITYSAPLGEEVFEVSKVFSLVRGTTAALCFDCGSANPNTTTLFHQKLEGYQTNSLQSLLGFVGATYFEKCARSQEVLSELHKVHPRIPISFGLVEMHENNGAVCPIVDMYCCYYPYAKQSPTKDAAHLDRQFLALFAVDQSSNEHETLHRIFQDPHAISTVKLLQLAPNFIPLTHQNMITIDRNLEQAKNLYFSHLENVDIKTAKQSAGWQWRELQSILIPEDKQSDYAYGFLAPYPISPDSKATSYEGMGCLIIHPEDWRSLISHNNRWLSGGFGSPLPQDFSIYSIFENSTFSSTVASSANSFDYYFPSPISGFASYSFSIPDNTPIYTPSVESFSIDQTFPCSQATHTSDVRPASKPSWKLVADPVDIITGTFYIDEVDLTLPGPFPLEIRRNYSSQNPAQNLLGHGWKLSLNPTLIKHEGKVYAAEMDGTIIVYELNPATSRWEVFPENNPELCNFSQRGIGGTANLFHSYIENDVLYGADGSKRIFKDGLLQKWIDSRNRTLTFFYQGQRLERIESSNGSACGFHYNHMGLISEIYSLDGRRIYYDYTSNGDLSEVTFPNNASHKYEYNSSHQIIKEIKPYGYVLENIYDKAGKVAKQLSPVGPYGSMEITATFTFEDGLTKATDGLGHTTTYYIYDNQVYKIVDPEGHFTLQSWFIDEETWFDAETVSIKPWKGEGSYPSSLKSCVDKRGLQTSYLYDSRGNAVEVSIHGEDLTGNHDTSITKTHVYNSRNLCVQEVQGNRKILTTYDNAFPYLCAKVEVYTGGNLTSLSSFTYDDQGFLKKENHSGAITHWHYDSKGFPREKIEETGTEDPDVVTCYKYNSQGQCIKEEHPYQTQKWQYDILGNPFSSLTFALSGELISGTHCKYDDASRPIWKQTENSQNILHIDYNALGLIKATRQILTPSMEIAYHLYEYNILNNLIEEVNPLGYVTSYEYDSLNNLIAKTEQELTHRFTYEPGGKLRTSTTPLGQTTTRLYTTQGLLQKTLFPDGTTHSTIYDTLGRPIQKTENQTTYDIIYNDSKRQVTYIHQESKAQTTETFDARGNLITFQDESGALWESSYDNLNRLKSKKTPTGEITTWSYVSNQVICTRPNGEKEIKHLQGETPSKVEVFDLQGNLIALTTFHYDPKTDTQTITQGSSSTTTTYNTLGLPIKITQGEETTTYEYDAVGGCIAIIDGEGRTNHFTFDALQRRTSKTLPSGATCLYDYDDDSNLIAYHLPDQTIWRAFYDAMGNRKATFLEADGEITQHWQYIYEDGYLTKAIDPLLRTHTYTYDSHGRPALETLEGWERSYTYDLCGRLKEIAQSDFLNGDTSTVTRRYDLSGRLIFESITLNSQLLSETRQTWTPSSRALDIGSHSRHYTYQNNQLINVSSSSVNLDYDYDLGGNLIEISTPYTRAQTTYTLSARPDRRETILFNDVYEETLDWDLSGKLSLYQNSFQSIPYAYHPNGHLQSAGQDSYTFNTTGTCVSSPLSLIHELDPFGRVTQEVRNNAPVLTTYDPLGQTLSENNRTYEWDPWGQLIKITDPDFYWEAKYDALGRRLQTHYYPNSGAPQNTISFYDPEEEFQEIGIQINQTGVWKYHGPTSCDALSDDNQPLYLSHNTLGHLIALTDPETSILLNTPLFPFGPKTIPPPHDLLTYAHTLSWKSAPHDPTGLIHLGKRYYDPQSGRFLSSDPVGHPACPNLYTYANGDPINYHDPDGRFFIEAWHRPWLQGTRETVGKVWDHRYTQSVRQGISSGWNHPYSQNTRQFISDAWDNPRFQGGLLALGGAGEFVVGAGMTYCSSGLASVLGWPVMAHGADRCNTGLKTVFFGIPQQTATNQLLQKTGMSAQTAGIVDDSISIVGCAGALAVIRANQLATLPNFRLPQQSYAQRPFHGKGSPIGPYKELQKLTRGSGGQYQAHHILEQRHMRYFGYSAKDRLGAPAQILSRQDHQSITNALRNAMPYGDTYYKSQVWETYKTVYAEYPGYLEAIKPYLVE